MAFIEFTTTSGELVIVNTSSIAYIRGQKRQQPSSHQIQPVGKAQEQTLEWMFYFGDNAEGTKPLRIHATPQKVAGIQ